MEFIPYFPGNYGLSFFPVSMILISFAIGKVVIIR